MKKLVLAAAVAAVAVSSSAFADLNKQGFYVGGDLGWSKANDGDAVKNIFLATDKASNVKNNGGFGWRALIGWNFNRNFAIEGGYTRFANNTYKNNASYEDVTEKVSAWDLVGKASLPIVDSNFDVYAKAGAAYQRNKYEGIQGENTNSKFRPVAGVGAAYNFDNGLAVDVSWTRVFGSGKTAVSANETVTINQPDSDLVAVGLTYTFQNWA